MSFKCHYCGQTTDTPIHGCPEELKARQEVAAYRKKKGIKR